MVAGGDPVEGRHEYAAEAQALTGATREPGLVTSEAPFLGRP